MAMPPVGKKTIKTCREGRFAMSSFRRFLSLCLMIVACGTTPTERAVSGGAIGAGAVTGAVTR